jgi:uncharacterized protein YkwD
MPLAFALTFASCSTSDETTIKGTDKQVVNTYDYNQNELKMMDLINDYRESIGLSKLEKINYISYKSEEHNEYMIANNVVNHDYFSERSQDLINLLGATRVSENIAYNYLSPEAALAAWLNSPDHKANIEGDFTDFGVSITTDAETGKIYYTNMFIKK